MSGNTFRADLYKGKVVVVSGGGTGICREMTRALMNRNPLSPSLLSTPLTDYHCDEQTVLMQSS